MEFKQNKKQDKRFEELTISDLQDIFAIQQKLMVQIDSMNIGSGDLKNDNWAEFDMADSQVEERQPAQIPTTQSQREVIRQRAERASSRSRSRSKNKQNSSNLLDL